MGIKQLSKFLRKVSSQVMSEWHCIEDYSGNRVAIDASPCIYQCLTAMSADPGSEDDSSHVLGFLKRTVRLLELGLKPIFVFDGEAPEMKKDGALAKREKLRAKSREQLAEAQAAGDETSARRLAVRLVKAKPKHNEDCMELLRLMGVPVVQAPTEAESVCAALAASGRCDAAATEDLDALVFGAPRLLRNIHQAASASQAKAVQEIALDTVLKALNFSQKEFVDFCILCGCDYLSTIGRVGVQTAYQLMSKHRSIERILETLDRAKYTVPEPWEYEAARQCFLGSPVHDIQEVQLEAHRPDASNLEGLRALVVERHGFHAGEVDIYIQRLARATHVDQVPQHISASAQGQPSVHTQRPIATPSRFGHQPRRGSAGRRHANLSSSNSGTPEKGQRTLTSLFVSAAKRPLSNVCASGPVDTQADGAINEERKEDLAKETSAANVSQGETCPKRRRITAESALRRVLGNDISLGHSTCLEDLERLVTQLCGEGALGVSNQDQAVYRID